MIVLFKYRLYILCLLSLAACGSPNSSKTVEAAPSGQTNTTSGSGIKDTRLTDTLAEDEEMAMTTYFVVIADTGQEYYTLHQEMTDLNRQLQLPIDTMRRSYDPAKNLIALPEDDEDEMYAGDYFPRRYPSENLSLEYLNVYKDAAGENTIALVTGIYETSKSADSARALLQKTIPGAFVLKADVYIGCMH